MTSDRQNRPNQPGVTVSLGTGLRNLPPPLARCKPLPRYALSILQAGVVPMTTGPGDQGAAETAARGCLRASHADREHAIDVLKAAFVEGMLAKAEFDERLGQTFASRTYAELAAVTGDIPVELARAEPPPEPAGTTTQPPVTTNVRSGIRASMVTTACAVLVWVVFIVTRNHAVFLVAGGAVAAAFVATFLTATQVLGSWVDKRSGGQLPPRPAQFGQTLDGERDGGPGSDLTLCQARGAPVPASLEPRSLKIASGRISCRRWPAFTRSLGCCEP